MNRNAEIITLLKNRDEKGISLLYDYYSRALLGIAFNIVGSKSLAEEILNASILKIWTNIEAYDSSKGAFFTWMNRIVKNTSLDMRKSKAFVQSSKLDSIEDSKLKGEKSYTDTSGIDTERLLQGLDDKYKIVLDYLYLKGYTQKEASEELNIPLGTIKTRLKKAIDILRKNIDPEKNLSATIVGLIIFFVLLP